MSLKVGDKVKLILADDDPGWETWGVPDYVLEDFRANAASVQQIDHDDDKALLVDDEAWQAWWLPTTHLQPLIPAAIAEVEDCAPKRPRDVFEDGDLKIGRRGVKAPLHEVPLWALEGVARVFDYGGRKYAPGNWIKASKDGEQAVWDYFSAAARHIAAMQEHGLQATDDESSLPHFDHALCSLIMARGIAIRAEILRRDPGANLSSGDS